MTGVQYAVWPQGMPDAVRFSEHPGAVMLIQTAMAIATMGAFGIPPRIRVARSIGTRPDPHELDVIETTGRLAAA